MIDVKEKSKIHLHWKVSPYDYTKEKENAVALKVSKKYGIPRDKVKVIPEFLMINEKGEDISINSDIIQNIQEPSFQLKLFQEYIDLNNITDYDFELIKKIDSEINAKIDYQIYDKYKRYNIKWIRWDNFLSYGADNFFDFTNIGQLALLSSEPANQGGKTTFCIDLFRFLLFGTTTKYKTQDKFFNKHIPSATNVVVEGCITIDGVDYIIKRTLSRPALERRTSKSKTTQKVEYYKIVGDAQEELEEYVDNQQEENSTQTNKAIKEAIGRESDFDLIMSVTDKTLDDLVEKKETERGRLLARWIGLLPIEQKDVLAREKFNGDVKPYLLMNRYNTEALSQEIQAYEINIKTLLGENKKYKAENKKIEEEIKQMESTRNTLLSSKRTIDDNLIKIDITTLQKSIESLILEGKGKSDEIETIDKKLKEIGDVAFSIEKYDELVEKLGKVNNEIAVIEEKYRSTEKNLKHLESSRVCPVCGREMQNFDKKKLEELKSELENIVNDGKEKRKTANSITSEIGKMKSDREKYETKSQLTMKKAALELNVERLRGEYKEKSSTKKEYEKNKEAIDANNKIDLELRNSDIIMNGKRATRETNLATISKNENEVANEKKQIEDRKGIIEKIKEEEKLVKNWKIYLELVGKDGIAKMVLRKTLPIINARLAQLLNDVCDFDVEVGIDARNDVMFYLIKDGVRSDLYGASGFELTASALALRSVLAEMSTIPRCDEIVMDEIFGRISKENYPQIKSLIEKIAQSYRTMFIISHIDDIKDWCDTHIIVKKENNISKIVSL